MTADKRTLTRLEEELQEAGYTLRYEKGHFRAGHCIVQERKVVVINKFFDTAARIRTLEDLLQELRSTTSTD